ncbi:hypothetical protein [Falsiroseomonas sp.]|uniref:hypothetical protein n=1 Tax=Falsiroseomonas sp. TaxID=2870721 RepID=UPI002736F830|nr:hypothetical protein [Falsiroseomonas sp.]
MTVDRLVLPGGAAEVRAFRAALQQALAARGGALAEAGVLRATPPATTPATTPSAAAAAVVAAIRGRKS